MSQWATSTNNIYNNNAGFVLIGAATIPTPSDANLKLAVNGNISSKKIKVTQLGWADYVFDPSYTLLPLMDVEQFIKQHKHLPEVPSASEIEKEGLDLGDGQAVLLKKIEKLTLYVIEQHKKIEQLEEQNKSIKNLQEEIEQIRKMINKK